MAAKSSSSVTLKLDGLAPLLASLRKVAPETKKRFTAGLKQVGQIVVDGVKQEMPRRSGKAARSVKVKVVTSRGREGIQISEGGAVAPYVPWLDFGGTVGRGRKTTKRVTVSRHASGRTQVRARNLGGMGTGSVSREFIKEGRYMYPQYEKHYDDMVQAATDAVVGAAESAGLEVTST